jgi:hypothetical protein
MYPEDGAQGKARNAGEDESGTASASKAPKGEKAESNSLILPLKSSLAKLHEAVDEHTCN